MAMALATCAAGCAGDPCLQEAIYDHPVTAHPLRAPPGLELPPSDPKMEIPNVPPRPFHAPPRQRLDGSCIIEPPRLPDPNAAAHASP